MTNAEVELTEFSDLITRYTADFVGREWLVRQVQALVDEPDCHFVVLTGEPGVGKTAFLAHLAATHPQWPRYFIRRDSQDLLRPGDASTFLLTIGGQLATLCPHLFHPENLEIVVRQRIESLETDGEATGARIEELRTSPFYKVALRVEQVIRQAAGKATALEIGRLVSEPRLLQMQDLQYLGLLDPARLLAQENPDRRIVVLVDALDELRYRSGPTREEEDILDALNGLPEMPPNLRFVISSRPEAFPFLGRLLARGDARELPLDATGADNQADLRTYVESALRGDGLKQALANEGVNVAEFTHRLLDKAAGNFLYLKSVLSGIQEAQADPAKRDWLSNLLRIEELPDDLNALYGYFLGSIVDWGRTEFDGSAWREFLRPLLGTLAVAKEPLSAKHIVAFTGIAREDVHDLLRELRQFVVTDDDRYPTYRIYHTSFVDYLLDSERNLEYLVDGESAHRRIADHYLHDQDWLKIGLPEASVTEELRPETSYGLNHLAEHLYRGDQLDELSALIVDPQWYEVKLGFDLGGGSFAGDIDWAIRAAEKDGPEGVSKRVAYSLLRAFLRERAGELPPEFMETLVHLGEVDHALKYAHMIPSPRARAKMLYSVASALQDLGEDEDARGVLHHALDSLLLARGEKERTWGIPDWMRETESEETLSGMFVKITDAMGRLRDRAGLRYALTRMHDLRFIEALYHPKPEVLISIARNLVRAEDLENALQVAEQMPRFVKESWPSLTREGQEKACVDYRTQAFIGIAEELVDAESYERARQVLAQVRPVLGGTGRALILSGVARIAVWNRDIEEAKEIIGQIGQEYPREQALAWLAEGVAKSGLEGAEREALEIAKGIMTPRFKGKALRAAVDANVSASQDTDPHELLPLANELDDRNRGKERSQLLRWIADALAKQEAWEEARLVATQIENAYWRGLAWVDIAEASIRETQMDLAVHCLYAASDLLTDGRPDWGSLYRYQDRLRCFVASAWAPVDQAHGLAILSAGEFPSPCDNLKDFRTPCDLISRAYADLGEHEIALQWAEAQCSAQANALLHIGRRLIESGETERAIAILHRAAESAIETVEHRGTCSWHRFEPYGFTESTTRDRAIWTWHDAIGLAFEVGGPSAFSGFYELVKLTDVSVSITLERVKALAYLEYQVEKLGWDKQASLARAEVEQWIHILIPSSDVVERSLEQWKCSTYLSEDDFWLHTLGDYPPRWMVYRYAQLDDEGMAGRLLHAEHLVRAWIASEESSIRQTWYASEGNIDESEIDEATSRMDLSIGDRNRVVCALADRMARFRQYDRATQVADLARITNRDLEQGFGPGPTVTAQLALLNCRLGDPLASRELLQYVLADKRNIPRKMLFGQTNEAFIYAANTLACLADQEQIASLREFLRRLLRTWARDEQLVDFASEVTAGSIQYIAPASAALEDAEGLKLALELAQQITWGDDQADAVVAVTKAMALIKDTEGLDLVFTVAQEFSPEHHQGWGQQLSKIAQALADAQNHLGNYDAIFEIVQWLSVLEPPHPCHTPPILKSLAHAIRLLAEAGRSELAVDQGSSVLQRWETQAMREENPLIARDRVEGAIPAYLDIARAYAEIQSPRRSARMLRRARTLIERQMEFGLASYALLDMVGILVDSGELDKAVSILPDFTYRPLIFSAIQRIASRLMSDGDLSRARDLLDQYQTDSEPWETYWRLYPKIVDMPSLDELPVEWVRSFLDECASFDDLATRSNLCVMAADSAITQGGLHASRQLLEFALSAVEHTTSFGREELSAILPLIRPITELQDLKLLHRIAILVKTGDFRHITALALDENPSVRQSAHRLMEDLTQAMSKLHDSEGVADLIESAEAIGFEQTEEYSQYSGRHLHPLTSLGSSLAAEQAETSFVAATQFRRDVIALLAKALGQLKDTDGLLRLAMIRIPFVAYSSEFVLEYGADGHLGRELFQLLGKKGITELRDMRAETDESKKPVLLSNLAWAVHSVAPGTAVCRDLLRQAISAIEPALHAVEKARRSQLGTMTRTRADEGAIWASMSSVISVVGAIDRLIDASVAREDLFEKAMEVAGRIHKSDQREDAVEFIVRAMAHCGLHSRATDLALSIVNRENRDAALAYLVRAQVCSDQILEAVDTATSHSNPEDELVFEIAAGLERCSDSRLSPRTRAMLRSFHTIGTRDTESFWRCFRAMLPVIQKIGGPSLLVDTWKQVQEIGNLLGQ